MENAENIATIIKLPPTRLVGGFFLFLSGFAVATLFSICVCTVIAAAISIYVLPA